ncbi:hypothetical protein A5875_002005, partial [Enterococcus sp. 3H8_DIV0648]
YIILVLRKKIMHIRQIKNIDISFLLIGFVFHTLDKHSFRGE